MFKQMKNGEKKNARREKMIPIELILNSLYAMEMENERCINGFFYTFSCFCLVPAQTISISIQLGFCFQLLISSVHIDFCI